MCGRIYFWYNCLINKLNQAKPYLCVNSGAILFLNNKDGWTAMNISTLGKVSERVDYFFKKVSRIDHIEFMTRKYKTRDL